MERESKRTAKPGDMRDRQEAQFVDLMVKFEGARTALVAINELRRKLSKSQGWTADMDAVVEEHSDQLGGKLSEVAWKISGQQAETSFQLMVKATALQFYCDESPDDLMIALVTSLCRDVM